MEIANSFATSEATEKAFDQLVPEGGRASLPRGSEDAMGSVAEQWDAFSAKLKPILWRLALRNWCVGFLMGAFTAFVLLLAWRHWT